MTIYTLFLYIGIIAIALTAILGYGHTKIRGYSIMHPVTWFIQYFMGSLLLFSGLVKAVDPLGTAYKMKDYFTEFHAQGLPFMDFMHDQALAFSLFTLVIELILGACLLLGLGQKRTTWTTLLMMLFFTLLTGFNYLTGYTNKEAGVLFVEFGKWESFSNMNIRITDCGCFGDFLKLTPLQTFIKDIIYVVLSIYMLKNTSKIKELIPIGSPIRKVLVVLITGVSIWFCLQNFYLDKPMVDFRPFAEGVDMNKAKEECASNPGKSISHYTIENKETKEVIKINSDDYLKAENSYLWKKDENGNLPWAINAEKTRLEEITPGCNSYIQYFENYEILEDKGYNLLVLSIDLDKTDKEAFKKIGKLAAAAEKEKITTRCLYNYISEQPLDAFRQEVQGAYSFETADDKLIKTMLRANPGLILIKDGVIIKKWHHKHIPDFATIQKDYMK